MNLKKQKKEHKKMGVKRFFDSIKYSAAGLKYAYGNEQSLIIHGIGSIIMIILGLIFQISFLQWAILIIASVVVLAIELLNTAIEATVDLITNEIHPLAKIAKDCGSAAGGVCGVMMFIIGLFIFVPYFIELFK